MTNPIEQYLRIQSRDNDIWFNLVLEKYEMREIQQAFAELGRLRKEAPLFEWRLVSISVTLLEGIVEVSG